jgi:hypothetical protein
MMSAPLPDWIAAVMRGWEVVRVDELERDLGAERLRRLGRLALQLDVGLRDEVVPAHDVELGALRERRRLPRGHDTFDAGGGDRGGRARHRDELPAIHAVTGYGSSICNGYRVVATAEGET